MSSYNGWKPSGGRWEKPTPDKPSPAQPQRHSSESDSFVRMGQMFCKGVAGSEDTDAITVDASIFPASHASRTTRFSERTPLRSTTIENQTSLLSVRTPPATAAANCLSDAVTALLPTSMEMDGAACGACWEGNSKALMMIPSMASPRHISSNPVIEALGLTPKSKHRLNKYTNSMNTPGNGIPTPAQPRRKKYNPAFGGVPESVSVSLASLQEGSAAADDDDDAFLPDDFNNKTTASSNSNNDNVKPKENELLYTEADLKSRIQEALVNQESVLATKTSSEDELNLKELEEQMQSQLEAQGQQWNRDLQERLGEARALHKKKKSVLKARITQLEAQCQELETSKQNGSVAREQQIEEHQLELKAIQEASSADLKKLQDEMAQQKATLSELDNETAKCSENTITNCSPGFIRDMQNKLCLLQNEKAASGGREIALQEKVKGLEQQTSHLEAVVSALKEGGKVEQQKLSDLQNELDTLGSVKSVLEDENKELYNQISDGATNVSLMELELKQTASHEKVIGEALEEKTLQCDKMKDGFQRCIDTLIQKVVEAAPERSDNVNDISPFDETDWAESAEAKIVHQVDNLCRLVRDTEQRALKAQEASASYETQKVALAKEQKERVEATQMIEKLKEHLQVLQDVRGEMAEKETGTVEQLKTLQEQLKDSEARLSEVSESMAKKELENADLVCAVETAHNKIAALKNNITDIRDSELVNAEAQSMELREKVQQMEKQHAEKSKQEESQLEELRFMFELKENNGVLNQQLRERGDEFSSLEIQKKELARQVTDLQQRLDAVKMDLAQKDTKLGSLCEDASKGDAERDLMTKKIDAIVAHVEEFEAQHKLASGGATSDGSSSDMQKLERIEQDLVHTIADFVRNKVSELEQTTLSHQAECAQVQLNFQTTVKSMEGDLAKMQEQILTSSSEIDRLEKIIVSAEGEASQAEKKHQAALQEVEATIEELEVLASEKTNLNQTIVSLQTAIEAANVQRESEIAAATQERQKDLEQARQGCEKLQKEVDDFKITDLNQAKRIDELETLLETSRADCKRVDALLEMRSGNVEEELLKRTAELEKKSKETIERCEAQVRAVRKSHGKELDEMLAQLDLVENEQKERDEANRKLVKEKDIVVAALGTQLAETQNRITCLEESLQDNTRVMENAEEGAIRAKIDAESSKDELAKMKEVHSKMLDAERQKKAKAIEAAREETIHEAEEQFKKANDVYRKLVHDYKTEQSKVAELSSELALVQKELEKMKKVHASKIAEFNSDVAELKASQAKNNAAAAREVKNHLDALERIRGVEKKLKSQVSQQELTNRSTQKLLASVVAEKEKLISENDELKIVCEEAMSLYESSSSKGSD